ncbi:MAG: bestrophin family protein, partial [Gemmataceae bacterium]
CSLTQRRNPHTRMITYDRHNWFRLILRFRGTVLPRVLGRVAAVAMLSLVLTVLKLDVFPMVVERLKWDIEIPSLDPIGHTVLGVALGMLIVFRTNSSNSRYWEGRSHWGMLVNQSRSLVRIGQVWAGPADDLARLVAAYVLSIKQVLRDDLNLEELAHYLPGSLYERVRSVGNPPTRLARAMEDWVHEKQITGKIDTRTAQLMTNCITIMVDQQGACEKIHKTPLPFIYASLIKLSITLYVFSLPFVLIEMVGFAAPAIAGLVALGMRGMVEAGV